ncbi:MAG: hypothetical protein IT184_06235 [Acidobacteria bacterium]|nr:hypothetical protein [Acidobacteriota bacterium]
MPRSYRVRPVARRFRAAPLFFGVLLALLALPRLAAAQMDAVVESDTDWTDAIPAHLSVVEGDASLERDGQLERAIENMPLLAGDRLVTKRGRVEVLFADGSVLDVDESSAIEFLSDELLRLTAGRVRLTIARGASPVDYRVDAAGTSALIGSPGEYRLDLYDASAYAPEVRLTVMRGSAELSTAAGRTLVRAGYEARATAQSEPSLPSYANASAWDDFERWALNQRDGRLGVSAQYLPAELRYYSGAFDRDGWWRYQQDVGYVWYPRVAADWRPYYDGGWSYVGVFGWTWVGGGRWGWPTHHYGRWGFSAGAWYWIPGRRWAPAWVSWASAPGYVGWCPLGWDNRPVVSIMQVNIYNNRTRGWTVLPDRSFGTRYATPRSFANSRAIVVDNHRFAPSPVAPVRPASVRDDLRPLRAPTPRAARAATARERGGDLIVRGDARSQTAMPRARSASAAPPTAEVMPPRGGDDTSSARPRARALPSSGAYGGSRTPAARPGAAAGDDRSDAPNAPTVPRMGRSRGTDRSAPPSAPPPSTDRPQYGRRAPSSLPSRPAAEPPSRPTSTPSRPSAESSRPSGGSTARARSAPAGPPPSSPAQGSRSESASGRARTR